MTVLVSEAGVLWACVPAPQASAGVGAVAAGRKFAFMKKYRRTVAGCFAGRGSPRAWGPRRRVGKTVPIVTSFGHTSADAPRAAADLGSANPLRAGRLGPARLRLGVCLLRVCRPGGARTGRLAHPT